VVNVKGKLFNIQAVKKSNLKEVCYGR